MLTNTPILTRLENFIHTSGLFKQVVSRVTWANWNGASSEDAKVLDPVPSPHSSSILFGFGCFILHTADLLSTLQDLQSLL